MQAVPSSGNDDADGAVVCARCLVTSCKLHSAVTTVIMSKATRMIEVVVLV